MKIKRIVSQNRRDFTAIYVCESCGTEVERGGYDGSYFHNIVIPEMKCGKCGLKALEDYRALTTKYPDGQVV